MGDYSRMLGVEPTSRYQLCSLVFMSWSGILSRIRELYVLATFPSILQMAASNTAMQSV